MTDEPKKMLTLAEEVVKVLAAAPKPLALAALKKGLEAAGVSTGKGGITKAQLDAALEGEGVYQHPSKKDGGKPSYWHQPPRAAEEIAAEVAAKEAKTAAAAQAKLDAKAAKEAKVAAAADAKAAKEADAVRKLAEKEAKAAAAADAKAAKEADAARKLAEKEAKAAAVAAAKAVKEADAAAAAQAKVDAKAAKEAEAARKIAEKADKPFRELREKVHAKVLELGDKIVAGAGIGKPGAKAKPELHAEFEKLLKQLIDEGKLFEHPKGKYGKHPVPPVRVIQWHEKPAAKKKIAAFLKAAENVLAIEGATLEYLFQQISLSAGEGKSQHEKPDDVPTAFANDDLKAFAASVLDVARNTGPESRFHENKVFISAAWHACQDRADFPKLGLAEFKRQLVEANQQHLLNLSRANEVQMMNAEMVKESETLQLTHTFHFILV